MTRAHVTAFKDNIRQEPGKLRVLNTQVNRQGGGVNESHMTTNKGNHGKKQRQAKEQELNTGREHRNNGNRKYTST